MLDNALNILIRNTILAGLTSRGYSGIAVMQMNQPTQQGANIPATIYFTKLSDDRYGFLGRSDDWDEDAETMVHTEVQNYISKFQIQALSIQNPANTSSLTASDLVNITASILQSDSGRKMLWNAGVGILRITDIRNPYFKDDSDRFEAVPSFDFELTHQQIITSTSPIVSDFIPGIYPI